MVRNKVIFEDLGKMSYEEAWDYQTKLHNELIEHKRSDSNTEPAHHLLFVEHPHVYTLGKSGTKENLLIDDEQMEEKGIEFFRINRGGDITYHGPGQIVAYPIFDLDYFKNDVRWYVDLLEEAVINTIAKYGLKGKRIEKYTGVWIDDPESEIERKICAIGVHLSRWVSLHGLAFNVNTDLDLFKMIIPCGIEDRNKSVTSLAKELGEEVDYEEVKATLKGEFSRLFELEFIEKKQ